MNLELKEITPDNWKRVNVLEVKKEQKRFVASNLGILAKAFVYRMYNSKVYGIFTTDNPIGLIMQRDLLYNDNIICILDQFMIDKDYQGKGYGKAALELWISIVKEENIYNEIKLCYIQGDMVAENMYGSLGFVSKPEEDDEDELVMVYELQYSTT